MKSDLYDSTFFLYSIGSGATDINGDPIKTSTLINTYDCQIDNISGSDPVRFGKNNEISTHIIFTDGVSITNPTTYYIECQNMILDILFIARNSGGLTPLTRGIEIYCSFRGWIQ